MILTTVLLLGLNQQKAVDTCSRWFLARGYLYPEDGSDAFFRNVGLHNIYTALHPRRRYSSRTPLTLSDILVYIAVQLARARWRVRWRAPFPSPHLTLNYVATLSCRNFGSYLFISFYAPVTFFFLDLNNVFSSLFWNTLEQCAINI
jgi:hypothetical protein